MRQTRIPRGEVKWHIITRDHTQGHVHENKKAASDVPYNRAHGVGRKMVENDRDCSEVLIQLSAIGSAVQSVSRVVLKEHLSTCIVDAVRDECSPSKS